MLALLIGCDEGPGAAAADAFLDAHEHGTVVVQYGGPRFEGAVGTRWRGRDLAAWLAPCEPIGDLDLAFAVGPETFPWEVDDDDVPACVRERLSTFPFDPPSARGDHDTVHIRWRPSEPADATPPPAGVPPFAVVGENVRWDFDDGVLRFKGGDARALDDAEGWARALTCPAPTLDLVRVVIAFDDGDFDDVDTFPENACVEKNARKLKSAAALVVLDVPVGPW